MTFEVYTDLRPHAGGNGLLLCAHSIGRDGGHFQDGVVHPLREQMQGNACVACMNGIAVAQSLGHTMGACGALEAWISIEMMRAGWFAPTLNLHRVDPQCAKLDYIIGEGRELQTDIIMSNNFAFGGINTSLIFKRWSG